MVAIITTSTLALSLTNLSVVLEIDLIVILTLIGLLITKEFLGLHFDHYGLSEQEQEGKLKICGIIDIAIVPFLYVFSHVLIYRALSNII